MEKPEDVVSNNTVRLRRGKSTLTLRYLCLPDTVEPRGLKESGR
jgi:hypothetical protein